jgi:hypothetical protein
MRELYYPLGGFVAISPPFLASVAILIARRVGSRRWIVHVFAVLLLFAAMPLYLWGLTKIDPIALTEDDSVSGGALILIWITLLVVTLLGYAFYAWSDPKRT